MKWGTNLPPAPRGPEGEKKQTTPSDPYSLVLISYAIGVIGAVVGQTTVKFLPVSSPDTVITSFIGASFLTSIALIGFRNWRTKNEPHLGQFLDATIGNLAEVIGSNLGPTISRTILGRGSDLLQLGNYLSNSGIVALGYHAANALLPRPPRK